MSDSDKPKKKTASKPKKDNPISTLRERWSKGGGSADIRMTTQLINAICDKIELK